MRKKTFGNIGAVAVNDITLCDTEIGLYMPIEKMSANIKEKYDWCENAFAESFKKNHPKLNLKDFVLFRDIALHMNIYNSEVSYSVAIILWVEDDAGEEIESEFYDPFEIEINAEDNKYLKKLVMNKLMDSFF